MREIFRLLCAAVATVALMHVLAGLDPARARVPNKQIELTAKQVESFIAAQRKMATAKADSELEAIAKEYGFAGLDELDDVEDNILLLIESIDPQSRAFTEPPIQIKRRIDEVMADRSIPEDERKQALVALKEDLKSARPIQYPSNIELVKRYYDEIQEVLR